MSCQWSALDFPVWISSLRGTKQTGMRLLLIPIQVKSTYCMYLSNLTGLKPRPNGRGVNPEKKKAEQPPKH
jgi:hypothetical protein